MHFTADALYCTLIGTNIIFGSGNANPVESGLVVKIGLGDGSAQWTAPFTYMFWDNPRLILSSDEQEVVLLSGWNDQIQVRNYATADGIELGAKFEPCDVDQCALFDAILTPDGTLRMVNDTTDYLSGSEFQMITMQSELDEIFGDGFGG